MTKKVRAFTTQRPMIPEGRNASVNKRMPNATAGAQDGVTVDTDYYIRDNNPLLRTFSIDPACAIRLLDPSGGAEASVVTDVAGLAAFLATVTDAQGALFEIALSGTTVTQILQYYMP